MMTAYRSRRALAMLLAAAAAGCLLWLASRVERDTLGGYWEACLLVAAAGLVIGLVQIRGRSGDPPAFLLLVFVPVLVVAGWVIVAQQPDATTTRDHVLAWSKDIGVADVVRSAGTWIGVLAFGIGFTLGLAAEPAPARLPVAETPVDPIAADAPVTAEQQVAAETQVMRRQTVPR